MPGLNARPLRPRRGVDEDDHDEDEDEDECDGVKKPTQSNGKSMNGDGESNGHHDEVH